MAESGRVTEPGFGSDRELNTLQNARIASRQMHIGDKRRSAWRLAGDSYRGVIRLIGTRDGREENKQTCEDRGGYGKLFINAYLWELIFQKGNASMISKEALCPEKFRLAFFNESKAIRPELVA